MNNLRRHLRKTILKAMNKHDISYAAIAHKTGHSRQNVWKALQPPGPGMKSADQIIKALKKMGITINTSTK